MPNDDIAADDQDARQLQRVFKVGDHLIVENENLMSLSNEEAQQMLAFTYPEVANATITTSVQNNQLIVEFMVKPGRKG
jgi:hypothetical protein